MFIFIIILHSYILLANFLDAPVNIQEDYDDSDDLEPVVQDEESEYEEEYEEEEEEIVC